MSNFDTQDITQESGASTEQKGVYTQGKFEKIDLHTPVLEDVDHPLVPELDQTYRSREINGRSDLEVISYTIEDPDYFTMIEGEAGVGKNMALKAIAQTCNWPMLRVNFSIGTTYQSLVGRYAPVDSESTEEETIDRSEAIRNVATRIFSQNESMEYEKALELASLAVPSGSSFAWVDGLLTKAVKNGWMFVADEINAAEDEAIMPLNGLTEDRESRYLTIEEKSEVITPHERFRFIATRNPIDYAGVSEMNSALQSRAYVVEMPYHDDDAILEIIKKRSNAIDNVGEAPVRKMIEVAQNIRRQEQSENDYITKISTRDLIKASRLTDMMDMESAVKTVFLGIADPSDKDAIKGDIRDEKFQ